MPKPDNRVTVDRDGHVHLAYTATNDAEADGLYHELRKILNHVGLAQHHVLDKNFYMSMDVAVAGRHERLPQYRRGEPGAHRHGQRDPRRRAPADPDGLNQAGNYALRLTRASAMPGWTGSPRAGEAIPAVRACSEQGCSDRQAPPSSPGAADGAAGTRGRHAVSGVTEG